jgi:histidinol-phosphate aminotransferase
MSSLNLIRADLKGRSGYDGGDVTQACRLHANELPWSPLMLDGLKLNQYPSSVQLQALVNGLAQRFKVNPEQLVLTRGSDEGLDLLMRLFLQPRQDAILQCPPTFAMYAFFATLQQARVIQCPLSAPGFIPTVEEICAAWSADCKLIMLCRPNNPTGGLISLETIAALCALYREKSMIVVDEAYIEFAETESAATLLEKHDNLIVLRTLSKAHGLAGLRLGAVMANADVIQALKSIMTPFAISSLVIQTAIKALSNEAWFDAVIEHIIRGREQLSQVLKTLPWVDTVYESHANFLLVKTKKMTQLVDWLESQDIAVRAFVDCPFLHHCFRITIGSEAQMQKIVAQISGLQSELNRTYEKLGRRSGKALACPTV